MSPTTLHGHGHPGRSGAHATEYRGMVTAADFDDVRGEFSALGSGCGVFDLAWRAKLVLTGSDRVRWLNGMVTNNVRDLALHHGVYAFLLNPQGRILGDLYAYNRGEYLLVETDGSQLESMRKIFDHYIIMDDVEVTNGSEKLTSVGVAGANARRVMQDAGLEVPELAPLELRDLEWRKSGLTLVRGDSRQREWYELWLAPQNLATLWDALVKAGASPVGTQALELYRIAQGIPAYGQDIRERDLPQETGQENALHFSKGCYVGQEIVERIHSRGAVHRIFGGFMIEGALPVPGTKIQMDGKEVGELTSVASLPAADGEQAVALGYARREALAPGKELRAGGAQVVPTGLPFPKIFAS